MNPNTRKTIILSDISNKIIKEIKNKAEYDYIYASDGLILTISKTSDKHEEFKTELFSAITGDSIKKRTFSFPVKEKKEEILSFIFSEYIFKNPVDISNKEASIDE